MAQAATQRPPFRADHVGSLLRPKALRDAFRHHAQGELSAAAYRRDPGSSHPRRRAAAGGCGPAGRHRRRVPPQLLLGPLRRALQRLCDQARGVQVPRRPRPRGRFHGHLCRRQARAHAAAGDRRVRVPAQRHQGDAEDHHAGAVHHALLPLHRFRRPEGLRRCRDLLCRPGENLPQEIADLAKAGCRYIQLDEVAVAMLCDPAIRERISGAGQNPDRLVDLYIKAINDCVAGAPADMVIGVHMCRGNFRGRYLSEGGYEFGRRALLRQHQSHPLPAGVRHGARRRLQAAALRAARTRASCSASSAPRRPCSKRSTICKRRTGEAAKFIDLDRLGIGPQCGFASTAAGNPLTEARRARQAPPAGRCRPRDLGLKGGISGCRRVPTPGLSSGRDCAKSLPRRQGDVAEWLKAAVC